MTTQHRIARVSALAIAFLLIAGILWGGKLRLSAIGLDTNQNLRLLCIGLWVLLVPAWFTFEQKFFEPAADEDVEKFGKNLDMMRFVWMTMSAIVGLIIAAQSMEPNTFGQS